MSSPKRLEIYFAALERKCGSVQHGWRPVLIVQNDTGNLFSDTVIVVPITSKQKKEMPTHLTIGDGCGVNSDSIILCEQITTISKSQLLEKIGELSSPEAIDALNEALSISIGLKT